MSVSKLIISIVLFFVLAGIEPSLTHYAMNYWVSEGFYNPCMVGDYKQFSECTFQLFSHTSLYYLIVTISYLALFSLGFYIYSPRGKSDLAGQLLNLLFFIVCVIFVDLLLFGFNTDALFSRYLILVLPVAGCLSRHIFIVYKGRS